MTKLSKDILKDLRKLNNEYPDYRLLDIVGRKEKTKEFKNSNSIEDREIFYRRFCNAIGINTVEEPIQKKTFYGVTMGELIDDGVLIQYNEHNKKGQILRTTDGEVLYTWLPEYDKKVHMYWCGVITKDKQKMLSQPMNFTTDAKSGYFYIGNGIKQTRLFEPNFVKLAVCEKCFDYIKSKNYGSKENFNFAQFSIDNKIDMREISGLATSKGGEVFHVCQYCGKRITELDDIKTDKNIVWCSDCDNKFRNLYVAKTEEDVDNWYKSVGKNNPRIENGFNALFGLIKYNNNVKKFILAKYMVEKYAFGITQNTERQDIFTFLAESNYSEDNADDMIVFMDFVFKKGVKVRGHKTQQGQKILGGELLRSDIHSVSKKMNELVRESHIMG